MKKLPGQQLNLFQGLVTNIDCVDITEAPEGFYAELKQYKGYNICNDCDARDLCKENKDEWCLKNRCMASEMFSEKYKRIIKRNDNKSIVFKRLK